MPRFLLIATLLMSALSSTLAACSKSGDVAEISTDTVSANEVSTDEISTETPIEEDKAAAIEIIWDDLMPVGEDALLTDLYSQYFSDLEARLNAGSQTLAQASRDSGADQPFDINAIEEGSAQDTIEQIGTFNVVESLNGLKVRIPGYVVPLDFNAEAEYDEFLLVPYFGACLHSPPPPPNQIVFVKANPMAKIENIYEPVWLEGVIKTGRFTSDLGNTAYELAMSKIEPYEY